MVCYYLSEVMAVIPREAYLKKIRPFMEKDLVKVLTGLRRSGKSTLLQLIQTELLASGVRLDQIFAINFESLSRADQDMMAVYREIMDHGKRLDGKLYIFLDEIQQLAGWEKMVNSLRVDLACDIYLTGSSSKLLSGELATHLAGRYIEIPVYPFSFSEIMAVARERHPERTADDVFQWYRKFGGMPFIYENDLDEMAAADYLRDIYNSILLKDIVARHSIRDLEIFERVIAFLLANVGQPFSGASLLKYLKNEKRSLSMETLYNYIAYAQDACLLYLLPREDVQGKAMLQFQEKIYLADQGIREAVYGNNDRDISQILENIVHLELLRRGYAVRVGKSKAREIDFVAIKGDQREYIQVAYLLADESVIQREFAPLAEIRDNYPKMVLSLDKPDFSREGIVHKNLVQFLLGE